MAQPFITTVNNGGAPVANAVSLSTDDGANWTTEAMPAAAGQTASTTVMRGAGWNGTYFCAIIEGQITGIQKAWSLTSPDGINWTVSTTFLPFNAPWGSLAWNAAAGVWCALPLEAGWITVGSSFTASQLCATSPDGLTWTQHSMAPAPSAHYGAIASNGTVFCAVAQQSTFGTNTNVAATSPDGINWTQQTLPALASWHSIAWNGAVFCAVGGVAGFAFSRFSATSADGASWSYSGALSAGQYFASVAAALPSTTFCAVGSGPDTTHSIWTSSDGLTWAARSNPAGAVGQIAWNGTGFCALLGTSGTVLRSADGISWSSATVPMLGTTPSLGGVVGAFVGASGYSDGTAGGERLGVTLLKEDQMPIFVAVGNPDLAAFSSDDGASWQAGAFTPAAGEQWVGAATGNGVYVAVGGSLGTIAMSTDGQNWTVVATTLLIATSVVWNGSLFCAVGNGSQDTYTSPDGTVWTRRALALPASGNWRGLCADNDSGRIVAFDFDSTAAAYSDDGGVTWIATTTPGTGFWKCAWNGSAFCVVSFTSGAAATSANGTSWAAQTIAGSAGSVGITAHTGLFCAISTGTFVATSADGASWSGGNFLPAGPTWFGIGWTGTEFIVVSITTDNTAVSANGTLWASGGVLPVSGQWTGIMAIPAETLAIHVPPPGWTVSPPWPFGTSTGYPGAFCASWRTVRFILQDVPDRRSSTTTTGDALNPATWTIALDDGTQAFTPLTVTAVDDVTYDVAVMEQLPSHLHQLRVGATTLFSGETYAFSFLTAGMVWQQVYTPDLQSAQRRRLSTDLANPPTYRSSSAGLGGTLVVKGGDYATVTGSDLVKKLIYRRLTTPKGGFVHMPEYGLGVVASKDLIHPNDLVKLRAEIERQCRLEPEVTSVRATVTLDKAGILYVTVLATTAPSGDVVEVTATSRSRTGA